MATVTQPVVAPGALILNAPSLTVGTQAVIANVTLAGRSLLTPVCTVATSVGVPDVTGGESGIIGVPAVTVAVTVSTPVLRSGFSHSRRTYVVQSLNYTIEVAEPNKKCVVAALDHEVEYEAV
jgi:hypothetical protein